MVEFGLTIGLFVLVIGGIVQFGIIFWTQNTITQVARETARYAATLSTSPCDPAARPGVASAANGLARGASLVNYRNGLWSTAPDIASLGSEGVGVDWILPPDDPATGHQYFPTDCPPSDNGIAVNVRVKINHVVPIFVPGLQFVAPPCAGGGFCLSTETEVRMEPKTR
jgi:TadE-like protein